MIHATERTHACPQTHAQPQSTMVGGGMRRGFVNEGQGGADGM